MRLTVVKAIFLLYNGFVEREIYTLYLQIGGICCCCTGFAFYKLQNSSANPCTCKRLL